MSPAPGTTIEAVPAPGTSPEYARVGMPWSRLLTGMTKSAPALPNRETAGATGINIYFPPDFCHDYHGLTWRELRLKQDWLAPGTSIASLWLRGFPLYQFNPDELTELVFRTCTELAVGNSGERGITLTADQCSNDRLALIRGLGFTAVKLLMPTNIDTGEQDIRRALETLSDHRGMTIAAELHLAGEPRMSYLSELLPDFIAVPVSELWLIRPTPRLAAMLSEFGYRQLGGCCFYHPGHVRPPSLRYSPWGFHAAGIVEWLGIGIAAPGIHQGMFHRNAADSVRYRNLVLSGRLPVAGWQPTAFTELPAYHRIQLLYCQHRIETGGPASPVAEHLLKRGWITPDGRLTAAGIGHFTELEQLLLDMPLR